MAYYYTPSYPSATSPSPNTAAASSLERNFWWLWSSLLATLVSWFFLQSVIWSMFGLSSTTWALRNLLQSQVIIGDENDWDLEMQPLEQAGTTQRRNLSLWQALKLAFRNYYRYRIQRRRSSAQFPPTPPIQPSTQVQYRKSSSIMMTGQQ